MLTSVPYIQKLVSTARTEYESFHELDESDDALASRIRQYCKEIGIAAPADISKFPWSATFISWCAKAAGATASEFLFSAAHAKFVKKFIANADQSVGLFRARPVDAYKPKVGDIVHRNRGGGKVTYAQARNTSDYISHSAIVVDLVEQDGTKFAVTIGGNEGNTIRRQRIPLKADGHLRPSDSNPYICVIENLKVDALPVEQGFESQSTYVVSDACDAAGEPEIEPQMMMEAAVAKPQARQEVTDHKESRNGTAIDHIVIHYTTSRNIEGTISHFKSGTPRTSAHYIVGRDGALVQMVPDSERAWHAGNRQMNARSIGIEHVAQLGDRITDVQSKTSIALIRFLMQTHGIPSSKIIPHVCVKPTSCCGDLFKDFGGGAGLSCSKQLAAVRKWLAANGIAAGPESAFESEPLSGLSLQFNAEAASNSAQRLAMAKAIVNFEARRDSQGRLKVYDLPEGDGGGRYEVAGINERYHKALCDELVELIRAGRHAQAELRATEFVATYTDMAANWTAITALEFYLRDSMFNRGPGGAAWILQKAVGVETDRQVGPVTLAATRRAEARPDEFLDKLRAAREAYERLRRDESDPFWQGLVNRWNKASQIATSFMQQPELVLQQFPVDSGFVPDADSNAAFEHAIDVGDNVPFIDNAPRESPSFHDIGSNSPIDNPARMLEGIRAFRNNVDPDVSLEVAIGRDTSLPSSFLEVLATQRRAVGKISTSGSDYMGRNGSWSGTGFIVAKNILLTNHHVLNSTQVASRALVDFGFEVPIADLATGVLEPKGPSARCYKLDPTKLFISSPVNKGGLDYTFVWIEDDAEPAAGSITMGRIAFSVTEGERAFIVHHPEGRGRRVSLDENDVLRITTGAVRYATDTMPGSSGSPVFDRQGRLIALHHASTKDPAKLPSGVTTGVLNEGIKIAAIVADLEARVNLAEGPMAKRVLQAVRGSDTMAGFFGSLGRTPHDLGAAIGVERVVDVYKGSDDDVDIGFWNIEWLSNRYHDREKLRLAAFLIVDLGLDIWGLEEVSPAAVRALVAELDAQFGEKYEYALSEPEAGEGKQSTAVIWKTKTVRGAREEWPADIERLWHLRSTDDLGLEAIEGKIFDRYPAKFRFSAKRKGAPFEFSVVPLHLKAMAEGSKRREQASRLLAHAVKIMTEKYNDRGDWVIGGDFNAPLASRDFRALLKADFVPLSAQDEQSGAFSYIKSPNSLIDHIFLSPNLAQRVGNDSYFIVAKDKTIDNYAGKLSDHRPVLVRISLTSAGVKKGERVHEIDDQVERLLTQGDIAQHREEAESYN